MLRPVCWRVMSRRSQNMYIPGTGIRSAEDVMRQKAGPREEEPASHKTHTIFGTKREDPFHYSDRKSGKGYSNYRQEIYWHRKFIYPPVRKHFRNLQIITFLGIFSMVIDWDWIGYLTEEIEDKLGVKKSEKPSF